MSQMPNGSPGGSGGGNISGVLRSKTGLIGIGAVLLIVVIGFAAWWFWPVISSSLPTTPKVVQTGVPGKPREEPLVQPTKKPGAPATPAPQLPAPKIAQGIDLPDLVTTNAPFQVPPSLPALLKDLNRYGSWLGFLFFLITANWAFHKERTVAGEEGDYRAVWTALVIFYIMGIVFPKGVVAALGDPLRWLAGRDIPVFVSVENLVIALSMCVIIVGIVKALDGTRDLTPASAAPFLAGGVLAWTQPAGTLASLGQVLMGIGALILIVEFWLRDPKSKKRRLWTPIAAVVGFLVLLLVKAGLTMLLATLLSGAIRNPSFSPLVRQVLAGYVFPVTGLLALIGGIVLGGLLATSWAGFLIEHAEKLIPGSLGDHDKYDAALAMAYLAAFWFLAHGGI